MIESHHMRTKQKKYLEMIYNRRKKREIFEIKKAQNKISKLS